MNIAKTQAKIIESFDRVAARCEEFVAVHWLAGEKRNFSTPYRRFGDWVRPSAVVLEVTKNAGLNLSVVVPIADRSGKVVLETLGKWDFRAPISYKGFGTQLCSRKQKHCLNAKRGCDLLYKICDYGFADKRGEQVSFLPCRWPTVYIPVNNHVRVDEDKLTALAIQNAPSELVETYRRKLRDNMIRQIGNKMYVNVAALTPEDAKEVSKAIRHDAALEDFSPVLGDFERNPFGAVKDLTVSLTNPASKILARHGLESAEGMPQWIVDDIISAMYSELGEIKPTYEEMCDALLEPDAPLMATIDVKVAIEQMPSTTATMLRMQASKRASREATDEELFTAVTNPDKPLVLSRLSAIQVNRASEWQETPFPYVGELLAPVDFVPKKTTYKFHTPAESADPTLV
ncbi:hypothetical protein EBZ80_18570 [bacterium]|nr:hypothetical protein [Betaproteobacteria bacterium]NDE16929.1 hypothetical protein [bacterium]